MKLDSSAAPAGEKPEPLPAATRVVGAGLATAGPSEIGVAPPANAPQHASAGFWRRLLNPVLALLKQGVTPDRLAATLAVGTVCSVFPFFGATTVLNLGAGFWLRLNHPILQTLNQLLGPLQLLLILVYVRAGEWMWQAGEDRFTVGEMVQTFRDANFTGFVERFGWAGVHAFSAWTITAPLLLGVIYFAVRPALRRAAKLRRGVRA